MNGTAGKPPHAVRALVAAACGSVTGCAGPQSTLDPHGPVAGGIATTWWIMAAGAVVVLALVMALVLHAIFRDPARRPWLPANVLLAGAGVILPTMLLGVLLVHGTDLGRRITGAAENALPIEVTGHRWWWEVRYPAAAGPPVVTANELRLPVGVPVEVTVTSADVIHSFWIPSLAGKMDMIPGTTSTLRLTATAAGRFRMQCAEFCGPQHARMGMTVVAESPERFARWRRARAAPAAAVAATGFERFMRRGCGECHRIDGTAADGTGGPVLTHFGDRPTVGAGAAPLHTATLHAWLADHGSSMKPGSTGPQSRRLAEEDVRVLAVLLEGLR